MADWRKSAMAKEQSKEPAEEAEEETTVPPQEDLVALRGREISELTNDLKRLQAEFENYKKRVERDASDRVKLSNQRLILDLLPVLDSFDKALQNIGNPGNDPTRNGLQGLHKQFLQTLQKEGLKEIPTSGSFDPFLHEAILREERDDVEDGKILEVYQKGYMLNQKTLRPARVKVARPKSVEVAPSKEEAQIHDTPYDETLKDEDQQKR